MHALFMRQCASLHPWAVTPNSVVDRLFDRFPETKEKFKRLNTSSAEAMRKSARVRAHAGRVLVSLGSVIGSLEDAEMVDETIFLLADSHNKRGVTPEDFQVGIMGTLPSSHSGHLNPLPFP